MAVINASSAPEFLAGLQQIQQTTAAMADNAMKQKIFQQQQDQQRMAQVLDAISLASQNHQIQSQILGNKQGSFFGMGGQSNADFLRKQGIAVETTPSQVSPMQTQTQPADMLPMRILSGMPQFNQQLPVTQTSPNQVQPGMNSVQQQNLPMQYQAAPQAVLDSVRKGMSPATRWKDLREAGYDLKDFKNPIQSIVSTLPYLAPDVQAQVIKGLMAAGITRTDLGLPEMGGKDTAKGFATEQEIVPVQFQKDMWKAVESGLPMSPEAAAYFDSHKEASSQLNEALKMRALAKLESGKETDKSRATLRSQMIMEAAKLGTGIADAKDPQAKITGIQNEIMKFKQLSSIYKQNFNEELPGATKKNFEDMIKNDSSLSGWTPSLMPILEGDLSLKSIFKSPKDFLINQLNQKRLTATGKDGSKIESYDGGKTWQPLKK